LEIYLLRHGEAGKRVPLSVKDNERELTELGRVEMRKVGEAMAELDYEFDVVASSPLKRATQTAEIVNKALGRKESVEQWAELSPEGSKQAFYRRLAKLKPGASVLCVGHEPYLTTAIGEMTSRGGGASPGYRIALKKGGLAKISVPGFDPRISGELRWLLTPRQIRKMA
jgi:phosphohistidine phosphatase